MSATQRKGAQDLGYRFEPRPRDGMLGYGGLIILLHSRPTFRHFDPSEVRIPIVSDDHGLETLEVRHPWRWGEKHRACCGRVILHDRMGACAEAFTFGGSLRIHCAPGVTECYLSSNAAILALHGVTGQVEETLVEEVEILLAERRAAWADKPWEFDVRLAACPPLTLYSSFLMAFRDKLEPRLPGAPRNLRRLAHALDDEVRALQAARLFPTSVPVFSELL